MIGHIAVVVPAADEEERIGAALDAVQRAVDMLRRTHPAVTSDLIVVLDGCTDATERIAAGYAGVRTVAIGARCVGAARDAGSRAAIDNRPDLATVWTAHTDADSEVPADWLSTMVRAADAGVDLFLGTVLPSREIALPVRRAWLGRHSQADGHRHVHGANLGIRASLLHSVGGWPRLPSGEDVELAARARVARGVVRSSAAAPVRTSARSAGRAPGGFAAYLSHLAGEMPA